MHCNKRPSTVDCTNATKRVKNSTVEPPKNTPSQLLQQLMSVSPQKTRLKSTNLRNDLESWNTPENSGIKTNGLNKSTTGSDSVLKNLLVSGCDVTAGYICLVPMRLKNATKV